MHGLAKPSAPPSQPPLRWQAPVWPAYLLCALPAGWQAGRSLLGGWGANPLQAMLQLSGQAALLLLLFSLALPLLRRLLAAGARACRVPAGRRLADWNPLMRWRRGAGLWACAYALLHLGLYATLDAGLSPAAIWDDLRERPAMAPGWVAVLGLAVLACSSWPRAAAWLGPWWARLHQSAPWLAALALAHLWLHRKLGQPGPWAESLLLATLWLERWQRRWRGDATPEHELPGR